MTSPDDRHDMTPLGLLERLSVGLGGRVDALEVQQATILERMAGLVEKLAAQEARCAETQRAKTKDGTWFTRNVTDPIVKQPLIIGLYLAVIPLVAQSCGLDADYIKSKVAGYPVTTVSAP